MDSGHTAWMLTASALVFFMTPGLAFFYGGLVRSKSLVNTIMLSFITIGVVTIVWTLWGYSLAYGNGELISGFIGDFSGNAWSSAKIFYAVCRKVLCQIANKQLIQYDRY